MDHDDTLDGLEAAARWPLTWRGLYPRERWVWFDELWTKTIDVCKRYDIPIASRWWESELVVETLAAFAAWVDRYDAGEWDDPPGKLALLFDIERITTIVAVFGSGDFNPAADRSAFAKYLLSIGAEPPLGG